MPTIKVVNIKCGGCEAGITAKLTKAGLTNVQVSSYDQTVSFEGNEKIAREKLIKMGYPPADTPEANNFLKKAKSYVSCMIGKSKQ